MGSSLIARSLIVFVSALLQQTPLVMAFGIKANIILVALIAYAFVVRGFFDYIILVLVAAVGIMGSGWLDTPTAAFIAVSCAAYGARRLLPFQPWLSYMTIVVASTAALYIIIDWRFIARAPFLFTQEVVYNGVIALCVFAVIGGQYEKGTRH